MSACQESNEAGNYTETLSGKSGPLFPLVKKAITVAWRVFMTDKKCNHTFLGCDFR